MGAKNHLQKIGILTASAIVTANMIGTGVFTSLGFQLLSVNNTWSIVVLWVAGGIVALCGAFAYAELGTHFPESGGDYVYLSRIFHPLLGFLSAWAGLTVGFSAPVALAAIAFVKYIAPLVVLPPALTAAGLILFITLLHSFTLRHSSRMQNFSTALKLLFIFALIGLGIFLPAKTGNAFLFGDGFFHEMGTTGFAVSMIFVTYSYTGWNAAAYVAGEIRDPQKNLPRALIGSTLLIILIYVLFQLALLKNATAPELSGKEEVSFIAFRNLLGANGGKWVSVFIALQLIATISSYLWVGPRVTLAMARDNRWWKPFSAVNAHGIPVSALWVHALISLLLGLTGSFEKVLLYAGFVLQLMSALTVATSLFIKNKKKGAFRTPLKPLPQWIYLAFSLWVLSFTAADKPYESLAGLGILLAGAMLYAGERVFRAGKKITGK